MCHRLTVRTITRSAASITNPTNTSNEVTVIDRPARACCRTSSAGRVRAWGLEPSSPRPAPVRSAVLAAAIPRSPHRLACHHHPRTRLAAALSAAPKSHSIRLVPRGAPVRCGRIGKMFRHHSPNSSKQYAIRWRTPCSRMLPRVIGGPGSWRGLAIRCSSEWQVAGTHFADGPRHLLWQQGPGRPLPVRSLSGLQPSGQATIRECLCTLPASSSPACRR